MATVRNRSGRGRALGVAVLAPFGALALLTGCSGDPGAAAVVDGTAIPVADVHTAVAELEPFFQGVTPTNILAVLIQERTVDAFAAEHDVAVSDQDARVQLSQAAEQGAGDPDREFSAPSVAISRYLLTWEKLSALPDAQTVVPDLQLELADLDVEVSPRFGAVGEGNELVEAERPWLVPDTAAAE